MFFITVCFPQMNSNGLPPISANPFCTHHLQTLKRCMKRAVCLFFRPSSSSSVSIKRFSRLWSEPISNSGVFIPHWLDSPHLALLWLSSQTDYWEEVAERGGVSTLHLDCWHLWTFAAWIPSHSLKTSSKSKKRHISYILWSSTSSKFSFKGCLVKCVEHSRSLQLICASNSCHGHAFSFVHNLKCELSYKGRDGFPPSSGKVVAVGKYQPPSN